MSSEKKTKVVSSDPSVDTPTAHPGRWHAWRRRWRGAVIPAAVVAGMLLAFVLQWSLASRSAKNGTASTTHAHDHAAADAEGSEDAAPKEATVWTCSMHPQVRLPEPGQCPICFMDLIPVTEGADDDSGGPPKRVTLGPRAAALARVETAPVVRQAATQELRLLGQITYDEARLRSVTAWVGGRIERLRIAETGRTIEEGERVADLYSPEVYAAEQDLIVAARQVRRLKGAGGAARSAAKASLEAARRRLELLGVGRSRIRRTEKRDRPYTRIVIRSQFAGTVVDRLVDPGTYVKPGTALYRVADLTKLWVHLDAYETDIARIRAGAAVRLEVAAYPGESFEGKVTFIDPVVQPDTRTVNVRVEVDNADGRLMPGMYADAVVATTAPAGEAPLVIPDTAPLLTGRRAVVFVTVDGRDRPTYEVREVQLGARAGDVYPVVEGLSEGERVVSRGAFMLDSDLQIRGGVSMMTRPDDRERGTDETVPLPASLREHVAGALEPYLTASERLADDDLAGARAGLRALREHLRGAVPETAPHPARAAWAALAPKLAKRAEATLETEDIEGTRAAFEHLSHGVIELLETVGNPLDDPVRLAFCPMAFDDRGAEWVQAGAEVDNAYFGHMMKRCGEIRATVQPGTRLVREPETATAPPTAAGGHQH